MIRTLFAAGAVLFLIAARPADDQLAFRTARIVLGLALQKDLSPPNRMTEHEENLLPDLDTLVGGLRCAVCASDIELSRGFVEPTDGKRSIL